MVSTTTGIRQAEVLAAKHDRSAPWIASLTGLH
jgi:hypothetical protein